MAPPVRYAALKQPRRILKSMSSSKASEAMQFDFSSIDDDADTELETTGAIALTPATTAGTEVAIAPTVTTVTPIDAVEIEPDFGAATDGALTVAEFYDRVKYAMRVEFPADVWVTGEIRKVTVSKGNRYLELADHHGPVGRGAATLEVACWSRDWPLIGAELHAVGMELEAGLVVRIRGRVSVWEGGARLRFSMTDLDVSALLGGIAAARRKLLVVLEQEGLLRANRQLPLPVVPIRIAIVTSAGSEAYRDFTGQLQRSGYAFDVRLEASLVQGIDAPLQIAAAIRRLHGFAPDVIVVVRGGGGKGDLAAFDSEPVARAIATSRYPVWTGIGHTGDQSVADEVAQRALITPSACGEAIVLAVSLYMDGIGARAQAIAARCDTTLERLAGRVDEGKGRLARAARHELDQAASTLALARGRAVHGVIVVTERNRATVDRQARDLARIARHALASADERLGHRRAVLDAYDPGRQLARGWSLTKTTEGRILRSVGDVAEGQRIITVLADGTLSSSVDTGPAKDIGPAKDAAVTKDAGDVSTKIEEATS
jgi:exodeoxyribonuclease VII large subunit